MTILQIIPIFIPSGNGAPLTEHDNKTLLSIWIILNFIWLISLIISLIKWIVSKEYPFIKWYQRPFRRQYNFFFEILDFSMLLLWAVIILVFLGYFMADFI